MHLPDSGTLASDRLSLGRVIHASRPAGLLARFVDRCPLRAFRALTLAAIGLVVCLAAQPVAAQKKYDPEHPEVLAIIRRAMEFVEENDKGDFGRTVIFAMAAYKSGIVQGAAAPKEHPLVVRAVGMIDKLDSRQLNTSPSFRTMYASALAAVLLLELDPEKHREQIQVLLNHIASRQQESGAWGYREYPLAGDTSQMQYIALALWLARQNGFEVDPVMCQRALEWMVQWQLDDGGWIYQQPLGVVPTVGTGAREVRHSLVAAGLGTVYLYADALQLFNRSEGKALAVRRDDIYELPAAVIDVTDQADAATSTDKIKPLVSMDVGGVRGTMNRGNSWFSRNFQVETNRYNLYYLYGFERYISMRQYLDGDVGPAGGLDTWYDQGVEFLKRIQQDDGRFRSSEGDIDDVVNTAFGILFLTQSMSITLESGAAGQLRGFQNFRNNVILQESPGGGIRVGSVEKSLSDFLDIMETSETDELSLFTDSLLKLDLQGENVSRGQQLSQLRTLVKHENWKARLIAVRFLGRQRSLDNVPALIFALTDPDPLVVHEANRGMMFVSRRTSGPKLSDEPTQGEKVQAVRKWTQWYRRISPEGVLLELPEGFNK